MNTETSRVVRLIEKTFEKSPWYGPSMMDVLSEVSEDQARLRVGQTHSILELVLHMTSWRIFTTRRLQGDNEFEVDNQSNFPTEGKWTEALAELKESQTELLVAARAFPDGRLGDLVPSKVHKYTYHTLLHGIVHHDIYHLGQIQLIKKSSQSE